MRSNKTMKIFIAACIAAFSFIGTTNHSVDAMTKYQVMKGDTFWLLAEKFALPIETIKLANNKQNDWLFPGEILQIPDTSEEMNVLVSSQNLENSEELTNPSAITITDEERDILERIVEAEAKGESFAGKVAVATVILNRVESPQFPNNIRDVVYQVVGKSYAFTPVKNGEINKPASEESKQAVEEALRRSDRLKEAVYFYNPKIATDNWIRTRQIVETIGNHVFAI